MDFFNVFILALIVLSTPIISTKSSTGSPQPYFNFATTNQPMNNNGADENESSTYQEEGYPIDLVPDLQPFPYTFAATPSYNNNEKITDSFIEVVQPPSKDRSKLQPQKMSEIAYMLPEFFRFVESTMMIMSSTIRAQYERVPLHPMIFNYPTVSGAPYKNNEPSWVNTMYLTSSPDLKEFVPNNDKSDPDSQSKMDLKSIQPAGQLNKYCVFQGISPLSSNECKKYLICLPSTYNRFNAYLAECPEDKKFSPIYRRCVQPYLVPECSNLWYLAPMASRPHIELNPEFQVESFQTVPEKIINFKEIISTTENWSKNEKIRLGESPYITELEIEKAGNSTEVTFTSTEKNNIYKTTESSVSQEYLNLNKVSSNNKTINSSIKTEETNILELKLNASKIFPELNKQITLSKEPNKDLNNFDDESNPTQLEKKEFSHNPSTSIPESSETINGNIYDLLPPGFYIPTMTTLNNDNVNDTDQYSTEISNLQNETSYTNQNYTDTDKENGNLKSVELIKEIDTTAESDDIDKNTTSTDNLTYVQSTPLSYTDEKSTMDDIIKIHTTEIPYSVSPPPAHLEQKPPIAETTDISILNYSESSSSKSTTEMSITDDSEEKYYSKELMESDLFLFNNNGTNESLYASNTQSSTVNTLDENLEYPFIDDGVSILSGSEETVSQYVKPYNKSHTESESTPTPMLDSSTVRNGDDVFDDYEEDEDYDDFDPVGKIIRKTPYSFPPET